MPTPPILFLIFNRPEQTKMVFQQIKKASPRQLFIAADGPRPEKSDDRDQCERTRAIVDDIDWDCEVKTLFRETNLGCEIAVSQGISWFFHEVERGIVLEDDCLPDPSFFPYCDELLTRYESSDQVGVITGDNFQWGNKVSEASYYFSKFPHCWGWASWRSAWNRYDHSMSEALQSDEEMIANFAHIPKEMAYWTKAFDSLRNRQLNTWDYRWMRSVWQAKLLTATPKVNLVTNIGFGSNASHTHDDLFVPALSTLEFPLIHPSLVQQHTDADARVARKHFGLSIRSRIEHRVNRLMSKWKRIGKRVS